MSLSPRVIERITARKQQNRSWYFGLALLMGYYQGSHRYHHTASATLFFGLHEALSRLRKKDLKTG